MSLDINDSSVAAMLVLAIGLAAHFSLSSDFFDKFNKDDPAPPAVVTTVTTTGETTSTSAETQNTETTAVVTTSADGSTTTEKTETSSKTENTATSSKKTASTSSGSTANRTTTSAAQTTQTGTRTTVSTKTATSTTRISSTSTTRTTTRILTSTSRTTRLTTTTRTTSRMNTTMTLTTSRMSTTMTQTTSRWSTSTTRTSLQLSTSNTTSRSTTSTNWGGMTTSNTNTTSQIPDSTSWIMSTTTNGGNPGDNYSDHTVSCDDYYSEPSENANVVRSSDIIGGHGDDPHTDLDELWDNSVYVFEGHVDKIRYTVLEGQTYTQVDITVRDSYKGRYSYYIGRKISVFFKGGYVPTRIYAKNHNVDFSYNRYRDYIYDDADIVGRLPSENDNLLFFLRDPDTETEPVSIRGFVPTYCESLSVFELYSTTYRSLGNDSVTFKFTDLYRRKENEW